MSTKSCTAAYARVRRKKADAITRRVEDALNLLADQNYESALLNTFPALDATAKLRRPTAGVGIRFRQFIQDQIGIIAPIGLSVVLGRDCTFGGVHLEDAWYNLARNTLVHEGELPNNFQVSHLPQSIVGGDWRLSDRNVFALILSIVSARENQGKLLNEDMVVNILGTKLNLNTLWGAEDSIRKLIVSNWPTPVTERDLTPYRT